MSQSGSNKKLALATLLAGGVSQRAAARRLSIPPRTVARWAKLPDVRDAIAAIRGRAVEDASAGLGAAMRQAVATLRRLLKDEEPRVRLGAARSIIALGLDSRDRVEIDQRLRKLEGDAE